MKLTNEQIRTVNNAYVFMNNMETSCFIQICTNLIELEPHANKVVKFLYAVAEKTGCLSQDKTQTEFKTEKQKKDFDAQTSKFLSTPVDVKLEVIKKSQLEGLKIPGSLVMELVKLKLIV